MKIISGYIREKQTSDPVPSANVTIRDEATGIAIAPGGMWMGSSNPVVTDASGYFSWSSELSPGPLRAEADINLGESILVRSGREMMQVGDSFISDMSMASRLFTDGIYPDVGNTFTVNPVTGQLKVDVLPGAANMYGIVFQTHTNRTLIVQENPTLTVRKDLVVLEQHIGGTYVGRQNIALIPGTVNNTVPAINQDPDVLQLPVATVTVPKDATSVTVLVDKTFATPKDILIDAGFITVDHLSQDLKDYIAAAFPGTNIKDSGTSKGLFKTLNFRNGLSVTPSGSDAIIDIPTDGITAAMIAANAVGASEIAANAVGASELAPGAVQYTNIANDAIRHYHILNGQVTNEKIANASIDSAKILNGSITGTDIASGTITATHLAANSVGSSELVDGAVGTSQLANNAITETKLHSSLKRNRVEWNGESFGDLGIYSSTAWKGITNTSLTLAPGYWIIICYAAFQLEQTSSNWGYMDLRLEGSGATGVQGPNGLTYWRQLMRAGTSNTVPVMCMKGVSHSSDTSYRVDVRVRHVSGTGVRLIGGMLFMIGIMR